MATVVYFKRDCEFASFSYCELALGLFRIVSSHIHIQWLMPMSNWANQGVTPSRAEAEAAQCVMAEC